MVAWEVMTTSVGGVWWIATFSKPQWALCGLMQSFHWSEPVDSGCLPKAAVPIPPGHSLGWQAPTQARGVSLPSGCPCLCLSCAVVSFLLPCCDPFQVLWASSGHLLDGDWLWLLACTLRRWRDSIVLVGRYSWFFVFLFIWFENCVYCRSLPIIY